MLDDPIEALIEMLDAFGKAATPTPNPAFTRQLTLRIIDACRGTDAQTMLVALAVVLNQTLEIHKKDMTIITGKIDA